MLICARDSIWNTPMVSAFWIIAYTAGSSGGTSSIFVPAISKPRRIAESIPSASTSFPEGYRHLGYLQSSNGFNVKGNLPGLRGPAVETLYAEGKAWLAGSKTPG